MLMLWECAPCIIIGSINKTSPTIPSTIPSNLFFFFFHKTQNANTKRSTGRKATAKHKTTAAARTQRQRQETRGTMMELPLEVVQEILSRLGPQELLKASMVCQQWNLASQVDHWFGMSPPLPLLPLLPLARRKTRKSKTKGQETDRKALLI